MWCIVWQDALQSEFCHSPFIEGAMTDVVATKVLEGELMVSYCIQ